ncbi:Fic family protein [Bifidobacterium aquikefiricola]|uniref:Fic family protein n=1 Tax=Bifidobacterium aquikefiricola TaxID=3059038 RepID=A0AB39U8Q5_9BIFI
MNARRDDAVRLAKRLLIDVLWKTANIEVDGITFPDTEEIFEGRAPDGMRVSDIVAVNNLKRAWEFLFDHVDEAVDWPFVSHYNRIIGESLIADSGKLRTVPVRIGGTDWVPPVATIDAVRNSVEKASLHHDPEQRAIDLFLAVSRGQWFQDGNKRTALLVANHCLINAGIGIFSVTPSLKHDFIHELVSYYESDNAADLSSWLRHHAIGLLPGGLTRAELQAMK